MEEFEYVNITKFYGFVYITKNLLNNKKYIGKKRFKGDWSEYLGSGVKLLEAVSKYGKNNFKREIIEVCRTEECLNARELYWIEKLNAVKSEEFYNISGRISGRRSRIIHIETGDVYEDVDEASKYTGVSSYDIRKSCSYKYYSVLDKNDKVAHFEIYKIKE